MITIAGIQEQLKLYLQHHPTASWGRAQNNHWDHQTNFIYALSEWNVLHARLTSLDPPLAEYAAHRWFNFWSARAVEMAFAAQPGVQANLNRYDRLIDFTLRNIPFDHKTSIFPLKYPQSLTYAQRHPAHLIWWLYVNQSREQRYHLGNRLFIILYAGDGQHNRLRAEVIALSDLIQNYVASFTPSRLTRLTIQKQHILSDILWFIK